MNEVSNTTVRTKAPAKPTDREIVMAIDSLIGDVNQLRRAALVLDEYANSEFRFAKIPNQEVGYAYGMGDETVSGITYMTDHVRELAWKLEQNIDKAFGISVSA